MKNYFDPCNINNNSKYVLFENLEIALANRIASRIVEKNNTVSGNVQNYSVVAAKVDDLSEILPNMKVQEINTENGSVVTGSTTCLSSDLIPVITDNKVKISNDKNASMEILYYDKNGNFLWHEGTIEGANTYTAYENVLLYKNSSKK